MSGDDDPEIYNEFKLYHIHNYDYTKERIEKFESIYLDNKNNFNIFIDDNETKFIKAKIQNSNIKIFFKNNNFKIVFF